MTSLRIAAGSGVGGWGVVGDGGGGAGRESDITGLSLRAEKSSYQSELKAYWR